MKKSFLTPRERSNLTIDEAVLKSQMSIWKMILLGIFSKSQFSLKAMEVFNLSKENLAALNWGQCGPIMER